MVNSCCAFGCTTRYSKDSGTGFFRFPKDEKRRFLWVTALRRKNFIPTKSSSLCGKHFYTGRPVKDENHPDYVPSIFSYSAEKKEIRKFLAKRNRIKTEPVPDLNEPEVVKVIIQDASESTSCETSVTESPKIFILLNCGENVSVPAEVKTKILSALNPLVSDDVLQASCVESVPIAVKPDFNEPEVINFTLQDAVESTSSASEFRVKFPPGRKRKNPGDENKSSYDSNQTDTSTQSDTTSLTDVPSTKENEMTGTSDYYDIYLMEAEREKKRLETDLAQACNELNSLREDVRRLQKEIAICDPTKVILGNKKQFKYYTGLKSIETFNEIIQSMEGEVSKSKVPLETQLLIVLMKLKLNLMHVDLAFRFKVAYNTIQKILNIWIPVLEQKYGDLITFFKRKKSKETKELVKKIKQEQRNVLSIKEEQISAVDSIQNWLSDSYFIAER